MTDRSAIIVEGGAMRGVFSAGVLDVFLEKKFHPFDLAIGVSAGACNLSSHLAGQHGRNVRVYTRLMVKREFIDKRRLIGKRSALDLDWLWDEMARVDPLNVVAAAASPTEFVVVATSRRTGHAVYLRPDADNMHVALRVSSALPLFYRPVLEFGGEPMIDGGVADPIPVEEAYRLGARRIMVVRSRPAAVVKSDDWGTKLMAWLYRREPAVAEAVRRSPTRYQQSVAFLNSPPKDCAIVHVAPPRPLATKRTTQDLRCLEADYRLGREVALDAIAQWSGSVR